MKITKYVHSCLVVETPERTALFDPGYMCRAVLDAKLTRLDDIIITHGHGDHYDLDIINEFVKRFPKVRITAPTEVVKDLKDNGLTGTDQPSEGIVFFDSPHEKLRPFYDSEPPQEIGVHYLDQLSDPGDSHSFTETKQILALPVQAPWGSTVDAVAVGLKLKPKYIVPIHDWHWSEEARRAAYNSLEARFKNEGITFFKMETGVPIEV